MNYGQQTNQGNGSKVSWKWLAGVSLMLTVTIGGKYVTDMVRAFQKADDVLDAQIGRLKTEQTALIAEISRMNVNVAIICEKVGAKCK